MTIVVPISETPLSRGLLPMPHDPGASCLIIITRDEESFSLHRADGEGSRYNTTSSIVQSVIVADTRGFIGTDKQLKIETRDCD